LTHFSLVLIGGLITGVIILIHGWIFPPGPAMTTGAGVKLEAIRLAPSSVFLEALYSAILAPLILGALQRIKRVFGFQPMRRRVRAW
jgi:hypothetical protein